MECLKIEVKKLVTGTEDNLVLAWDAQEETAGWRLGRPSKNNRNKKLKAESV